MTRVPGAPPAPAEDPLADLRAAYKASLPALVAELAELLVAAPRDPSVRARAVALAHRLNGTAGSFGFTTISDAARDVEHALAPDPRWERARAAFGRLQRALQ